MHDTLIRSGRLLSLVALLTFVPHVDAQRRPTLEPLVGTWEWVSRVDRDSTGRESVEPTLGRRPLGYLMYDAGHHVAAQLMAANRSADACAAPTGAAAHDPRNSTYVCSYDAYFGRYEVDPARQTVTHVLEGALSPGDVGKRLTRHYRVTDDALELTFDTIGSHGEPVTRTIVLRKVSG